MLDEYLECLDCGFVLLSDGNPEPKPKRVDACPDCGGVNFGFAGESFISRPDL